MTSQVEEGTWMCTGGYGWFRSEWAKLHLKNSLIGLKELTSDRIPPPQPTSSILNPPRGFDRVLFWLCRWSREFLMKETLSLFMEWRAAKSPFSLHQSLVGLLSLSTSSSSIVVWWKFKEKYTLFCLSVLLSTTSLTCQIDFYLAMSYAKKVQLLIGNELNTVWSIWVRRAELKNKPLRLWLGLADLKQTQNWENCFPCTLKNKVSCSPCIKMLQMAALGSEIMIMIIITVIGT